MSGCPFFSSKPQKQPFSNLPKPSASDPAPFTLTRRFSDPYFSPYRDLFTKYEQSSPNPLSSLEFHFRNSLFHSPYVSKFRSSELNSRILMANELREGGNRSFSKGNYSKACICYEHAFSLFNYCIQTEKGVECIRVDKDTEDYNEYRGIITQILVNYSYALDYLGNFEQAEIILKEAKSIWETINVKVAWVVCKLMNIETEFEELTEFSLFLKEIKEKNSKFVELEKTFEQVVFRIQQKKCEFWAGFFKEYSNGVKTKSLCNFDLEFKVAEALQEKYEKMIDYYRETENYEKVLNEKREVQRVLVEMKKVKKVKINDNDDIMLAYAKSANINLMTQSSWIKFEASKRTLVSKIFNQGTFNKRLLYECIQIAMLDYERKVEVQDKTDLELQFWQRNLIACLIFAVLAIYMAANPFRY